MPICYIFCECIILPIDIYLHLLQERHQHGLIHKVLVPYTIILLISLLPHNQLHHHFIGDPHQPQNSGCHRLNICTKDHDGLYYGKIYEAQRQVICSLLPQYPLQMAPSLTRIIWFNNDLRPVIVCYAKKLAQVLEGHQRILVLSTRSEICIWFRQSILLRHPPSLPFH